MKLILVGSRAFGAEIFHLACALGHEAALVCSPPAPDALGAAASAAGAKLFHPMPESPLPFDGLAVRRQPGDLEALHGVDLVICAHAHTFVPGWLRESARLGAIGYHPSLLPRHRGRDAVRWTIAMRDPVAGGTIYQLDDGVDTGPIVAQRHVLVRPTDDASSLWSRELFGVGVELLRRSLIAAAALPPEAAAIPSTPQDEACATWEPAFSAAPLPRA